MMRPKGMMEKSCRKEERLRETETVIEIEREVPDIKIYPLRAYIQYPQLGHIF
jgi:hypothetical protein